MTDGPDELPEPLMTLVELDVEGAGLDPALVADVCGSDRARILTYLRITSEQEIAWRQAAEEAEERDVEEASVCRTEAAAWDATHESLRAALRFVVDRRQRGDLESR